MEKIKTLSYDQCEQSMPQGQNCIDYFRRLILKDIPEEIQQNVWIGGGSVKDWLLESKVEKDIDFFSTSRESMYKLVKHLRSKYNYKAFLITKNAIKGYGEIRGKRYDIDIVKKPFQNITDCLDNFDFTVCCFGVSADKFSYHESAPFDLIRKRLVVHRLPHPVDSIKRLQKYIKKGFTACNGTILTIAKEISKIDTEQEDMFSFYKFD